jgi:hypothetical protein
VDSARVPVWHQLSRIGVQALTRRSLFIGLFFALFISGFCYFHDCVMSPGAYIRLVPHLMPHVVYGGLLLIVLLANPILRRLRLHPLKGGELAVIVGLSLVSSSVPFYGLVHCWPTALMLPYQFERLNPGWQREKIVDTVPKRLMADPEVDDGNALTGYVTGLGKGKDHISPRDVPWRAWVRPMGFWLPLVFSICIAMLALAVVIHRQWSKHEQLPYPISRFAQALFPDQEGSILRKRGFLIAGGIVFAIHMLNYAHAWWPEYLIPIQLRIDFTPLAKVFPQIINGDGRSLFSPRVMFAVIGITYFFASDVSLSLALFPYFMCYLMGVLTGYGLQVTRGFSLYNNTKVFLYTGGYTGVFLMSVYTGRYYYWNLLRQSVGLPGRERAEPWLAWSMRVFLAGSACFYALLCVAGLDWLLALYYTSLTIIVFTVISRAVSEAGGFYVGTWIMPEAVLWGFLGAQAVGPTMLATMGVISTVILAGPGWAPMPFAAQALKMAELGNVRIPRMAVASIGTLLLCIVVALTTTIYWQYDQGAMTTSAGWARHTAKLPFEEALKMKQELKARAQLADSEKVSGIGRLLVATPNRNFTVAFLLGVGLCLAVSFLRLRFSWWPLHPIVFVFFGSHQAQRLAFSFLLGWMVKHAITKYGGEQAYQKAKPVMVGLIAGEMLAGTIPVIVGTIYYMITGDRAVNCSLVL